MWAIWTWTRSEWVAFLWAYNAVIHYFYLILYVDLNILQEKSNNNGLEHFCPFILNKSLFTFKVVHLCLSKTTNAGPLSHYFGCCIYLYTQLSGSFPTKFPSLNLSNQSLTRKSKFWKPKIFDCSLKSFQTNNLVQLLSKC